MFVSPSILGCGGGAGGGGGAEQVSPPPSQVAGTATVLWDEVTENADGSPCTDLAGYRVHYSTNTPVSVGSPMKQVGTTTQATIDNLVKGQTYYFRVSSIDFAGNESISTEEISIVVN